MSDRSSRQTFDACEPAGDQERKQQTPDHLLDRGVRSAGGLSSDDSVGSRDGQVQTMLSLVSNDRVDHSRYLNSHFLDLLDEAARRADPAGCANAAHRMIEAGIPREDIADLYIPELARRLGVSWEEDTISFVDVTIGASRLQCLLRELGPEWRSDVHASPQAPSVLLLVPFNINHTLGAVVVAGQLRRVGLSVRLMLDAKPEDVAVRVRDTAYDAIFISCSRNVKLETIRRLVIAAKSEAEVAPPILIGGTILEVGHDDMAQTGVDYATNDALEAIRLCGLKIPAVAR